MYPLTVLLLALAAPGPYLVLGLAMLSLSGDASGPRQWLAPLLGCAAAGWIAVVSFTLGLSPVACVTACVGIGACVLTVKRAWPAISSPLALTYLFVYASALAVTAVVPFPALGQWSGDWLYHLTVGEAVRLGTFPPELLVRTPLFGAAASPLWLLDSGLPAYQIMAAAVAASALVAFNYATAVFSVPTLSARLLGLAILSPFFLLHLAALWPKLLAGGAVIASLLEALRHRGTKATRERTWSAAWLGIAVATHHSSILFLPLVLVLLLYGAPARRWIPALATLAVMGVVLAGPYELWIALRYGVHARASSNPVVTYRAGTLIDWGTVLASAQSSLIGKPFETLVTFWKTGAHSGHQGLNETPLALAGKSYFTLSAMVTLQAGTLVGLMLPLAIARPRKLAETLSRLGGHSLCAPIAIASTIAVVIHSFLMPVTSPWGDAQAGLTPLCLALLCAMIVFLQREPDAFRATARSLVGLGTLPFLGLQASVLLPLMVSSGKPLIQALMHQEADAALFVSQRFQSLATVCFPWGAPLALLAAFACLRALRRGRERGARDGVSSLPRAQAR